MEREVRPSAPMPKGYKFIRKGDVYITKNCRKQTLESQKPLYVVVDQNGKTLGLRCPSFVYNRVLQQHRETAPQRAAAVRKRDSAAEDKFKEALLKLFPKAPKEVVPLIINHALKKHSRRVGRTETMGLEDKAWLAVHAHIRHIHTSYDKLLRDGMERKVARDYFWPKINEVAKQWGRQDDVLPSKKKHAANSQRTMLAPKKAATPAQAAQKKSITATAKKRTAPTLGQKRRPPPEARVMAKRAAISKMPPPLRVVTRSQTCIVPKPINRYLTKPKSAADKRKAATKKGPGITADVKRPVLPEVIVISSDDEEDSSVDKVEDTDDIDGIEGDDYDYDDYDFIFVDDDDDDDDDDFIFVDDDDDDDDDDCMIEFVSDKESIIYSESEEGS
ncbi:hypothetical protein QBC43DRAFT_369252 [Cladorrhinum sp. PSN259]|nr:hypothetical protein QBC43DRAFT_369252 [Cladorrhinum sp. PSN259]